MAKDKTVYDLPKMTAKSLQKAFEERVNQHIQNLQRQQYRASQVRDASIVRGLENRISGLEDAKKYLSELVEKVD